MKKEKICQRIFFLSIFLTKEIANFNAVGIFPLNFLWWFHKKGLKFSFSLKSMMILKVLSHPTVNTYAACVVHVYERENVESCNFIILTWLCMTWKHHITHAFIRQFLRWDVSHFSLWTLRCVVWYE